MLISIIVPIYCVEPYLEKCLNSIFSQTYTDIEYIFVDDCSPDNSIGVLDRCVLSHHIDRQKVTIIRHAENKGISITRNDALRVAKGDYILFVDSDDWIESCMVENLWKATDNGKIDIVGCDYIKEYADGSTTLHHENYGLDCTENLIKILNYDIGPYLWKMLVKRDLYNKALFPEQIEIAEDYIEAIKLFHLAHSFVAVHEYLYHYAQYNICRYSNQIAKSIAHHIEVVKMAEDYLRQNTLLTSAVQHQLLLRKFNIKRYYLYPPLTDYTCYRSIFPEADGMWRFISFPLKEKIRYYLAEKHCFVLLRAIEHYILHK